MNALETLGKIGVVPVVKIDDAGKSPRLAEALIQAGLPCVEITFRTAAAEEAIRLISQTQREILVGAGTVLSVGQAEKAVKAGARFLVSPGFEPKIVDWCLKQGIPVIPGIATVTEALMGIDRGLDILKFFPSETLGGIPMLEAIAAALVGVKFIPTGGISVTNMVAYLKLPMVHAVGGSWMVKSTLISSDAFGEIARLAAEAVGMVRETRKKGVTA